MGRNGQISINRTEMDEGNAKFNQLLASLQSTVDGMQSKFSVAIEAGFLGNSISTISKQTASIGNSVTTIKNTINNKTNEMFDIDMKGAEKFDAIEIPTDFYANNDTETNEYNKVLVGKLDGKSVNAGNVTDSVDVHGDETTVEAVGLVDITGEAGSEHDRQNTKVEKENVVDISESGAQGVAVDAESGVANKAMFNVNTGNAGDYHEAGDAHVVDAHLGNVNNGVTANTANGGIGVNAQKESLQSLAAIGGLAAVSQGAQADSIINTQSTVANTGSSVSASKEEEIPVVNASSSTTSNGPTSTRNAAVDFGAVAGLAGAVGIGLAGLAGSKDKEEEEKEESGSEKREAVKEETKDDTNHLSE